MIVLLQILACTASRCRGTSYHAELCHLCHHFQRADEGAFGEFDFEGIVLQMSGASESCLRRGAKILLVGVAAFEYLLGFYRAPRLGANASQRYAHALHA